MNYVQSTLLTKACRRNPEFREFLKSIGLIRGREASPLAVIFAKRVLMEGWK